jgi:hypothetical protein
MGYVGYDIRSGIDQRLGTGASPDLTRTGRGQSVGLEYPLDTMYRESTGYGQPAQYFSIYLYAATPARCRQRNSPLVLHLSLSAKSPLYRVLQSSFLHQESAPPGLFPPLPAPSLPPSSIFNSPGPFPVFFPPPVVFLPSLFPLFLFSSFPPSTELPLTAILPSIFTTLPLYSRGQRRQEVGHSAHHFFNHGEGL